MLVRVHKTALHFVTSEELHFIWRLRHLCCRKWLII